MTRIVWICQFLVTAWAYPLQHPYEYLYPLAYPASTLYIDPSYNGFNYASRIHSYIPNAANEQYFQPPDFRIPLYPDLPTKQATLNVMAELPYAISKEFSAVPMFVVSKNILNMVSEGHITPQSENQPKITIKAKNNNSIECTPAIRMVLERPIIVGNLRTDILFPSEVQIIHEGLKVPIRIGAVIAPVLPETIVSPELPLSIRVVYAIPANPIKITITIEQISDKPDQSENAENTDSVIVPAQEALVVVSEDDLPPKNVTITDFPTQEDEPTLQVDDEHEGLGNRNPPMPIAPAGIVASNQPHMHVEEFHNPKESPLLEQLRDPLKVKKS